MWQRPEGTPTDQEDPKRLYYGRAPDRLHRDLLECQLFFEAEVRRVQAGPDFDEQEYWLDVLSRVSWYPVGIPPHQDTIEEPFSKTEDAIRLVKELMKAKEPRVLIVADTPLNIYARMKQSGTKDTLKKAEREARLLGFKDQAFFRAAQHFIAEQADDEERKNLREVSVLRMSELTSHPAFTGIFKAVSHYFETDRTFAEAVYECIPDRMKHRKHHHKSLEELRTLGRTNPEPLHQVLRAIPYVLYQISAVLFLGGEKLGHLKEEKYNRATQMAHEGVGVVRRRTPRFKEMSIPGASGVNPYRVVAGESAPKIPDVLTARIPVELLRLVNQEIVDWMTEKMQEFEAASITLNQKILDRLEEGLKDKEALKAKLPDLEDERAQLEAERLWFYHALALRVVSSRREVIEAMSERVRRMLLFGKLTRAEIVKEWRVGWEGSDTILDAQLQQELAELVQGFTQDPFYAEQFLLKWSGLEEALQGECSAQELVPRARRFLPVDFTINERFPGARMGLSDHRIFASAFYALLGRVEDGSPQCVDWGNIFDVHSAKSCTGWVVDFNTFKEKIFDPRVEAIGKRSEEELVFQILMYLGNEFASRRWSKLDELLSLIEGTELESIYQEWLAQLEEVPRPSLHANSARPIDAEGMENLKAILSDPIFNPQFRSFFEERVAGHTSRQ